MSVSSKGLRRRLGCLLTGALAFGGVMAVSNAAEAAPRVLRPGTHPWWFQGGFGPSAYVTGGETGGRGGFGGSFTQFMLTQEIGGHFSGDFEGPALAAHFAEAFGGPGRGANFRFTTGPRFYYDIQVNDQYGIYIAPYGQIGYTFWDLASNHYFNLQFGATCHIVLADRAVVGAQLVSFDFNIGDVWLMNYSMQFFGGVSW